MHSRLAELMEYVDAQRAGLLAAVAAVPASQRERRPEPEIWSVAEILEHLQVVELGIARLISRKLEKARAAGLGAETETSSLVGSLDHLPLLQREAFMPAPDFVKPSGAVTSSVALGALEQSRQALRDAVATGDGLALGNVSAPHALLGPLTLYQWVLFVGQHERRHALQVQDIARRFAAA
jgi:hypothetical protein